VSEAAFGQVAIGFTKEAAIVPKANDLEGAQDQGGKHGGQAGMPRPQQAPKEVREGQHKPASKKISRRKDAPTGGRA
jgi:hypothetical protein